MSNSKRQPQKSANGGESLVSSNSGQKKGVKGVDSSLNTSQTGQTGNPDIHNSSDCSENCTKCHIVYATDPKCKGKLSCFRCKKSFCFTCIKMNKTNSVGIGSRSDILWFCVECIPLVYKMFGGSSAPGSQSEGGKIDDSLAQSIVDKLLAPENPKNVCHVSKIVQIIHFWPKNIS